MDYKNILVEHIDEHIAKLTLNRPNVLNAFNTETFHELDRALDELIADKSVLGLLITGEGRAFAAGADLDELKDAGIEDNRANAGMAQAIFTKVENLPFPVVAAVNGFALGGGNELAMACDIRIASEKAKFGQPEVSLGVPPCYGGTQRLPRIVGFARAKELVLTGRVFGADEALQYGLVHKVVEPDALMDEALAVLKQILKQSPRGVMYTKLIMNQTKDMQMEDGLEFEKDISAICYGLPDKAEGFHAFVEKRDPQYQMERA